jgi:hypothetical protein
LSSYTHYIINFMFCVVEYWAYIFDFTKNVGHVVFSLKSSCHLKRLVWWWLTTSHVWQKIRNLFHLSQQPLSVLLLFEDHKYKISYVFICIPLISISIKYRMYSYICISLIYIYEALASWTNYNHKWKEAKNNIRFDLYIS